MVCRGVSGRVDVVGEFMLELPAKQPVRAAVSTSVLVGLRTTERSPRPHLTYDQVGLQLIYDQSAVRCSMSL